MPHTLQKIGIVGFGFIGAELYRYLLSDEAARLGLAPAFVHARRGDALAGVDPAHRLDDLYGSLPGEPSLIVEAAHPDITRAHGTRFLAQASYMPLSVSALADDVLLAALTEAATANGTRLLLPTGALVGGHSLAATRERWQEVSITFRKHPANIDFAALDIDPADIDRETVVFEGPVREIARLFPRNVNTMMTCALGTIGPDRCIGRMVADPALEGMAVAEVFARGTDGSEIRTIKRQPMVGVSGTEMFASLLRSIRLALARCDPVDII